MKCFPLSCGFQYHDGNAMCVRVSALFSLFFHYFLRLSSECNFCHVRFAVYFIFISRLLICLSRVFCVTSATHAQWAHWAVAGWVHVSRDLSTEFLEIPAHYPLLILLIKIALTCSLRRRGVYYIRIYFNFEYWSFWENMDGCLDSI